MTPAVTSSLNLTFEEYLLYDDGTDNRYELVDGELVLMTPPVFRHSDIVNFLYLCFYFQIQREQKDWLVRQGDVGVRTGLRRSRLPDVSVIDGQQWRNLENSPAVLQVPLILAVEVVSKSSQKTDYQDKRKEYADRRIPEYWIVDFLIDKVSVLTLIEDQYQVSEFVRDDKILSPTFPELGLTAAQVLAAHT
jgi:Uma2 family endonuclease